MTIFLSIFLLTYCKFNSIRWQLVIAVNCATFSHVTHMMMFKNVKIYYIYYYVLKNTELM